MRRLPALFAVLSLAAAAPVTALAQTPAPAAAPAPVKGVTVIEARAWLIGLGGTVAEPVVGEQGAQTLKVADQPLPWSLTFYACGAALCDDAQFSASFTGPITQNQINAWNRENRYLKAFFVPGTAGGEAGAIVQYDLVLTSTGPGQLQEPVVIWLQMLRTFAQGLAAAVPATN